MIFTVCQLVEKSWEHKSKAMWGNMRGIYVESSRSRAGWRALCHVGLVNGREARTSQASTVVRDVVYELCSRSFRRESDK